MKTPPSFPSQISGGTPPQTRLLGEIMRGLPRSHIRAVRLTSPPESYEALGVSWLEIDASATCPVENVRGFWQALLIAGTFRDTSASRGLPLVSGKTITVFDPDGNVLDGGVSAIAQPTEHRIETLTQERVREIVQRSTTQAGVTAEALAFARLLRRLGVEMVVRTDDPAGFFRNRPLKLSELLGELVGHERPTVEGTYVEVRDRGGRFVTASAYAVRTGEGVGYSSPRFESGTGSGTSPLTGG